MSEKDVLDAVEMQVKNHQPADYNLLVSREGASRDGNWWYVVVKPSREDVRARDYRDIMEKIEEELLAKANLKVLLVPTLPGD